MYGKFMNNDLEFSIVINDVCLISQVKLTYSGGITQNYTYEISTNEMIIELEKFVLDPFTAGCEPTISY